MQVTTSSTCIARTTPATSGRSRFATFTQPRCSTRSSTVLIQSRAAHWRLFPIRAPGRWHPKSCRTQPTRRRLVRSRGRRRRFESPARANRGARVTTSARRVLSEVGSTSAWRSRCRIQSGASTTRRIAVDFCKPSASADRDPRRVGLHLELPKRTRRLRTQAAAIRARRRRLDPVSWTQPSLPAWSTRISRALPR